jgi:hypothetical protein
MTTPTPQGTPADDICTTCPFCWRPDCGLGNGRIDCYEAEARLDDALRAREAFAPLWSVGMAVACALEAETGPLHRANIRVAEALIEKHAATRRAEEAEESREFWVGRVEGLEAERVRLRAEWADAVRRAEQTYQDRIAYERATANELARLRRLESHCAQCPRHDAAKESK